MTGEWRNNTNRCAGTGYASGPISSVMSGGMIGRPSADFKSAKRLWSSNAGRKGPEKDDERDFEDLVDDASERDIVLEPVGEIRNRESLKLQKKRKYSRNTREYVQRATCEP